MSNARRSTFGPVVLIGLLAASLAAVASSKSWADLSSAEGKTVTTFISSSGQLPLASALSLAALASWGALLVSRGRWRRWIALLGLVIALGSMVTAVVGFWRAPGDLRHAAETALGNAIASPSLNGWYWAALIADLVVVLALLVAVRDAPAWPTMSTRYDAPSGAKEPAEMKSSLDVWKALDQGNDPTDTSQ